MNNPASLLTIGLGSLVFMALGAWRLVGLSWWASLCVAAAFSVLTLSAVIRRRGVFFLLLGLFLVGCGVLAWYALPSRAAAVLSWLSGFVYTVLGLVETVRSRRLRG